MFFKDLADRAAESRGKQMKLIVVCGLGLAAFLAALAMGGQERSDADAASATPAATTEAASGDAEATKRPAAPRSDVGLSSGRVIKSLGIVLLLIVGGFWGFGKLLKRSRLRPGGDRVLQVVDALPLGPRRQVYVIEAYGRKLVVGASGDGFRLLSEFTPDETDEAERRRDFEDELHETLFDREAQTVPAPPNRVLEAEA